MFGFIGFSTSNARSLINFTTYLGSNINVSHGIHMNPSVAAPTVGGPFFPLSSFLFNFFYLKTWICPNLTVFNLITNMCENNTMNPSSGDISFSVIYI